MSILKSINSSIFTISSCQGADKQVEAFNREKKEILVKLMKAESALAEGNKRKNKLEEDNAKLRRSLEQSMTRLNRMSMDSDFLVDRFGVGNWIR